MSRNRNCIAPGAPFVCRSCLQVRFLFSCGRSRCAGFAESDRKTLLQIFRGRKRIQWRIDSLPCVCFSEERCAKSMYRICEKGILHNPPRFLCDFHRAATKGWPQNESCAILFSAPGISVSDPETTPNLWKQKPVLPGRSFPITKVEFIRVITKQKAQFPPPGKKSIFQAFTTEKRICCVLICNPMGFCSIGFCLRYFA